MLESLGFARSGIEKEKVAANGTCSWFLETHEWTTWVRDGGLLWISGSPGSGNSTVMTHALQAFKESPQSMKPTQHASFFFFGQGSPLERNFLGFYRSILLQIATTNHAIMQHLTKLHKEQGGAKNTWNWSEVDLKAVLFAFSNKAAFSNGLWIFVDALDEAGEDAAHRLSETFKELVSNSQGQIRICFSCRHYPVLKEYTQLKVCVENNNKTDIIKFSRSRIRAYRHHLGEEELEKVVDAVSVKSKGIFLWVALVIKFLSKQLSSQLQFILNCIEKFPPGLEDLYQERLNSIFSDQPGTSTASEQSKELERAQSRTLLRWLCFSMRPLTLQELKVALVLDFERKEKGLQECVNATDYIQKDAALRDAIVIRSRGLAHVYSEHQKVELIHQSVKDFLQKELDQQWLSPGPAHHSICSSCLKFLSFEEYEDTITKPNTFGHYARDYWYRHGYLAEVEKFNQSKLVPFIMSQQPQKNWISRRGAKQFSYLDRFNTLEISGGTAVNVSHILSACGLLSMLEAGLNQNYFSGNERDTAAGRTSLHWAVMGRKMEVVRFLLNRNDIDPNAKDYNQRTPLFYTTMHQPWGYISKSPHDPGDNSQIASKTIGMKTILFPLADVSLETVLSLILSNEKVDVNAQDNHGNSPFMIAAAQKWMSPFIRLLGHRKINIHARNDMGWTALDIASLEGHTDRTVLLLQENYARFTSKDSNDDFARSVARGRAFLPGMKRNHLAHYSRKVMSGTLDSYFGDHHITPLLHVAVQKGHLDAVACLLAHGCSPNALDSYGRGALHWAAKSGNEELVSLLMKWGANLNLRDRQKHKPFHKAILKGHLDIARYILQRSQIHDDTSRISDLDAAVMSGNMERALLWLRLETLFATSYIFESPFIEAVEDGDFRVAKWAFRNTKDKLAMKQKEERSQILKSCGSAEVRTWLESEFQAIEGRNAV